MFDYDDYRTRPASRRVHDEMDERQRQRERRLYDDLEEMQRLERERYESVPSGARITLGDGDMVVVIVEQDGVLKRTPETPFGEVCKKLGIDGEERMQAITDIVYRGEYQRMNRRVPEHFAGAVAFTIVSPDIGWKRSGRPGRHPRV